MAVEEFDRVAVQRDAALVHALATRTLPPDDVDIHDPIVTYFAAWVDWVDAAVDEDTAFDPTMGKDRVMLGKDRMLSLGSGRRRRAALIAGSTIAALVVSSGAAAAMTGDPFLVAKAPLRVLEKVNPFDNSSDDDGADHDARENLPPTASDVAHANKLLADAQRAAAQGDFEKAQRLVNEADALLGDHANAGQQHRIDKLVDDIAVGQPGLGTDNGPGDNQGQGDGQGSGDHGQPTDPGGDGQQSHQNNGQDDQGHKGDPVVNEPKGKGNDKEPSDPDSGTDNSGSDNGGDRGAPDDAGSNGQGKGDSTDRGSGTGKGSEKSPDDPKGDHSGDKAKDNGKRGGQSGTNAGDDTDGEDG